MEELQVIETTSGRQFKPWASVDDVQAIERAVEQALQGLEGVTAIVSEISSGKQAIASAINAKGGSASANESFQQLADDVVNLNDSFITYGVEVTEKIHWLNFICNSGAPARLPLTAIDDNVVTTISQPNVFQKSSALESVKMTALTTISGGYTFESCIILQEVNMPSLVTLSGNQVFQNCTALQKVNMPSLITLSNIYVFNGCVALQEVNMPNLVTLSGGQVFLNCTALQEIDLPSLATIGGQVFQNCTALQDVNMPILVTFSGGNVFSGCTSLRNVTFGTLTFLYEPFVQTKANLRNITIGQDTNINLPFQNWTANNVIAEGQSGIDELNSNIMTNLVPNLYLNGGKTLRLGAALYDVLTTATKDAITDRGWTLQRG